MAKNKDAITPNSGEISDPIVRAFCSYLVRWKVENWEGKDVALAERLKISKGQLSNLLKMRRCGNESWRRMVAEDVFKVPYEQVIGVERPAAREDCGLRPKTKRLAKWAAEVLDSGTHYADALESNILSFHKGVKDIKALNLVKTIGAREKSENECREIHPRPIWLHRRRCRPWITRR